MIEKWAGDPTEAEHRLIEPNRRLVLDGQGPIVGVEEYYDMQLNQRIINLSASSEQQGLHLALQDKGLPVFPHSEVNGDLLLAVPEGSRSLRHLLRLIARDVLTYRPIFSEVGGVMRQLHDDGFGLPDSSSAYTLLGAFAFSLNEDRGYGGSIFLAPPYKFTTDKSLKNELNELPFKLKRTGIFDQENVASLAAAVREGANYANGEH